MKDFDFFVNSLADSPGWGVLHCPTVVPTPPGKPQYFEVQVTEQSIFARWLQPEEGEVTGYELRLDPGEADERLIPLDASAQTYTFDNLEPGRNYSLSLSAVNDFGNSEVALQYAYVGNYG